MQTVQITLDDQIAATAELRANASGYGNLGDYVRALIEADQRKRAVEKLDSTLLEAISSGDATPMSTTDWSQIRETVRERLSPKAVS